MQNKSENTPSIRLECLHIENYKKIDNLDVIFIPPRMPDDPDVTVLGSKNGGGKTSVLECASILLLSAAFEQFSLNSAINRDSRFDLNELLIRSGKKTASIQGRFSKGKANCDVELSLSRQGNPKSKKTGSSGMFRTPFVSRGFEEPENAIASVLAFTSEPLIAPPLLHFTSYRKIQESNPELSMMSDDYHSRRAFRFTREGRSRMLNPVSAFKVEILRSMMGQASLFESMPKENYEESLTMLNDLLERYAGGRIEHLRPLPNNTIDLRVLPRDGSDSFTFDGLSSGQKEIISTLFLIWRNSQKLSNIVLIDEPELHLNAEWHADFISQLHKLAPHNQYLIATHSEEVFRSVDESHRILLLAEPKKGRK